MTSEKKDEAIWFNSKNTPTIYDFFYSPEFEESLKNKLLSEFKLKDPDRASQYLNRSKDTSIFDFLAMYQNGKNDILARDFCEKISKAERIYFIKQMLPFCIDHHNVNILEALLKVNKDITDRFENFYSLLTDAQQETLKKLLELKEINTEFRKNLLGEFVTYGNITDAGIKLTMAQLASRKSHFNPTVISAQENFSDYLKFLKVGLQNAKLPIREIFIVGDPNFSSGIHWTAGIIEVAEKNEINMLLIDSRGMELDSYCIRAFAKEFPRGKWYRNIEPRQYQPKGCSIYAMDDVRHLFTVEKYIKPNNIFDYLAAQPYPVNRITLAGIEMKQYPCHLPLSFERSRQSRLVETILNRREENNLAINKKEMMAEDCRKTDLRKINGKDQNRRIPYVYNKFLRRNMEFLEKFGDEQAACKMMNFSLSAFEERMDKNIAFQRGLSYAKGEGVEKDDKKAFHYLSRKDGADPEESLRRFAYCWQHGIGVDKDEKEAFRLYKMSAEWGSLEGQVNLGECYQLGIGVEKDEKKAATLYQLTADKNHADAQYKLGCCYEYGIGVNRDRYEAYKFYSLSADNGNPDGLYKRGLDFEVGGMHRQDVKRAVEEYKISAEKGSLQAKLKLGICYAKGIEVERNLTTAYAFLTTEQETGDDRYGLGYCLQHGITVEKDLDLAFGCYESSAAQGNLHAQAELAYCYQYGIGTEKDENKAFELYQTYAAKHNPYVQARLGYCYQHGIGVEKNELEAARWYQLSVEFCDVEGDFRLGCCYQLGIGIEKNEDEWIRLWHSAAKRGHAEAQYKLGQCYENGDGVSKNEPEAIKYYRLAAQQEYETAQMALARMRSANTYSVHEVEILRKKMLEMACNRIAAEQEYKIAQKTLPQITEPNPHSVNKLEHLRKKILEMAGIRAYCYRDYLIERNLLFVPVSLPVENYLDRLCGELDAIETFLTHAKGYIEENPQRTEQLKDNRYTFDEDREKILKNNTEVIEKLTPLFHSAFRFYCEYILSMLQTLEVEETDSKRSKASKNYNSFWGRDSKSTLSRSHTLQISYNELLEPIKEALNILHAMNFNNLCESIDETDAPVPYLRH